MSLHKLGVHTEAWCPALCRPILPSPTVPPSPSPTLHLYPSPTWQPVPSAGPDHCQVHTGARWRPKRVHGSSDQGRLHQCLAPGGAQTHGCAGPGLAAVCSMPAGAQTHGCGASFRRAPLLRLQACLQPCPAGARRARTACSPASHWLSSALASTPLATGPACRRGRDAQGDVGEVRAARRRLQRRAGACVPMGRQVAAA